MGDNYANAKAKILFVTTNSTGGLSTREYTKNLYNIEYSVNEKAEEYASTLRNAGNDYLAERAQDITDIFGRVLNEMLGIHAFDINKVPEYSVVVANTLSPTDMIVLARKKIAGLALSEGGLSSHVVILARNYGIPAVVGLNRASFQKKITNGEVLIVDTEIGEILADPDAETLAVFITVYNAVYYKNLEAFQNKYKKDVLDNLSADKCGLSVNYKDWPGNSQIVIPLFDIKDGGLSTVDTSVISDSQVVKHMQDDDDKNIESRKDMVDLKEREAEQASEKAQESQKNAVQEQKKLNEEKLLYLLLGNYKLDEPCNMLGKDVLNNTKNALSILLKK